jgi:hypothetical protein
MLAIPPHPCPSHYGGRVVVTVCRWDRCNWLAMEPKRGPPGPLSAQNVTGVPSMKLRSVLGHTVRPDHVPSHHGCCRSVKVISMRLGT